MRHRHLLIVSALLVVAAWWSHASGQTSVDEGVAVVQAQALVDGGWTVEDPLRAVDPEGSAFPLRHATRTDDGIVPFAKHPLYPQLLGWVEPLGGVRAMVALSLVSTVVAAWGASRLARRLDPDAELVAFYGIALLSPLLFDSTLVIAHALAAAVVGLGALALLRHLDEDRPVGPWLGGAAVASAAVVLLRGEGILLAGAATLVLAVRWIRLRTPVAFVAASGVGLGGLIGLVVDRAWAAAILGHGIDLPAAPGSGDSWIEARLSGLATTALQPSYDSGSLDWLLPASVLVLVLVAFAVRRGGDDETAARLFAPVAAVGAVVWCAVAPASAVPGLLVAFPLLWFGLSLGGWARDGLARPLVLTGAVLAAAVAATQYRQGGGFEWGARYTHLALPLVVPVVAVALVRAARRVDRSTVTVVGVALLVVSLALSTMGLRTKRDLEAAAGRLGEQILEVAPPSHLGADDRDGRPVVVSTEFVVPQVVWPELDDARWLRLRDDEEISRVTGPDPRIEALVRAGVDRFTFVTLDLGRDRALLGEARVVEERRSGPWHLVVVEPNMRSQVATDG